MSTERYSRQKDIVPIERISQCRATVIGVGAIGRQVALQLAAIGIPWLQLFDFDVVEESNLASQGYLQSDLGKAKVDATSQLCKQINPELEVQISYERFKRSQKIGNCIFCCLDSIESRKLIWDAVKDEARFFTDGRMAAEVLRVLTVSDNQSKEHYPTTLFGSEEAFVGSCTAKTTIYCANIAAGFMLAQFTKYLRQLPIEPDIQVNLLASEINVGGC
jgi:molybdopterin/thiamine biosynthesis adenylyltransferase